MRILLQGQCADFGQVYACQLQLGGARERTLVVIRVKGNVSAVQAQTRDKPTPTLLYRQFLDSVMTGIEGLGECGETDS